MRAALLLFVLLNFIPLTSIAQNHNLTAAKAASVGEQRRAFEVRFKSLTPGATALLLRQELPVTYSEPVRLSSIEAAALIKLGATFEILRSVISASGDVRLPRRELDRAPQAWAYGESYLDVTIPDPPGCPDPGNWVYSDILITEAPPNATVEQIDVYYEIIHTYVGDLDVDLNDQNLDCTVDLWENQGGSQQNIYEYETGITLCNGEPVNQRWYLWAQDTCHLDDGYIDYWSIDIYYTEGAPDLVIESLIATPSNPEVNELVDIAIRISNQGIGPTTSTFYVDFYRDRATAPAPGVTGDDHAPIPPPFNPGQVAIIHFSSSSAVVTFWEMWAQVDALEAVPESNESNNVLGPVPLAWSGHEQVTAPDPKPWSGWWWPDYESTEANLYDIPGPMAAYDEFFGLAPPNTSWQWEYDNHRTTNPASESYGHCPAYAAAAMYDVEPIVPRLGFTVGYQKGLLTETWGGGVDRLKIADPPGDHITPGSFWRFLQDIIRDSSAPGNPLRSDLVGGDLFWGTPVFASPIYAYEVDYAPISDDVVNGTITISYAEYRVPDYVGTLTHQYTYGFSNLALQADGRPSVGSGAWNGNGFHDRPQWLFVQDPGFVVPDENPYIDRDDVLAITQHQIGVGDPAGPQALPRPRIVLYQNQPNPFGQSTWIEIHTTENMAARLDIYDILGRRVRAVVDGVLTVGRHKVPWDGRSDNGEMTPSGVYFYRLTTDAGTETRRLLLVR